MKLKKILAAVAAAAVAVSTMALNAFAADEYAATLGFSDSNWTFQDWESSVQVTGDGQYTLESSLVAGAPDFLVFVVDIGGMYADHPEASAVLRQDALMSYASPQTGESVNIYRTDDYSENNPIYIIKGIDADGNEFEKEIDASKINPNNCSYNELMVLNVETGHTSPKDVIHAVAARDKVNIKSYFDKKDYISYANEVMKDYKTLGNWGSYLSINNWIKSIMSYAFKMN